jgi:TolB-like protein
VKATTKDRQVVVGGLMGETDEEIRLFDLKKNEVVSLKKSDVISCRKNVSDSDAALSVGAWRLLAWKIKQCVPMEKPTGRVAEIDGDAVYVTLGAGNSIAKEDELLVFREGGEIKDPVTGDVLGTRRISVARLVVTDVRDKYSKAKTVGDKQAEPKVGDQVEPVRFNNAIAVLPPVDADGDETVGGKYFAEQLCAELVRNHVTVVERMLLGKAMDELVRQQGREFNEETVEEIGKQVGAYAIATGSLLKRGSRIAARLRLIQVATGKVMMTSSLTLSARRFPELSIRRKVTKDELDLQVEAASVQGGKAELGDAADVPARRGNQRNRRASRRSAKTIPTLIDKVLRLTRKDGPYQLAGEVTIAPKGALYLERGTLVYCVPGARINAKGRIGSYGDSDEFVMFRPMVRGGFWDTIALPAGLEQIIEGFDLRGATTALEVHAATQVVGCVFVANKVGIKLFGERRPQTFTNCLIANNLSDGMSTYGHEFLIDHCTIANNGGVGLHMTYYGSPRITFSNVSGNAVGVKSGRYKTLPEIHSCNIVGNRIAIDVHTQDNFRCQDNYWGSDQQQVISAMIVDGNDRAGVADVWFQPFSSKPIADAGCSLEVKR